MLDANLYTLNFVRSTVEPDKLFLIQESTGEPIYFRLRVPEGSETRTELYHASTLAPLGVFQHISSKLKLISLHNPSSTIEMKNSGYIHFEWTFYFDKILKFCWKKDIIGMAGGKRGYTCWMSRKPDPDYPCAIYRPGTSTVPPSCQFLDFNIRRIENLQDPRGLEFAIILALLGFTETPADQEPRRSPTASPPLSRGQITSPSPIDNCRFLPIEPNELRVTENSSTSDLVTQGHKLFEDPLFLYLSVHAPTPKAFKQATHIAEQIKRDRYKRHGEELYQYLVDDIISQELTGGEPTSSSPASNVATKPSWLKVYLSRTPLDELLPKSISLPKANKPKLGKASPSFPKPQLPPKEPRPSSFAGSSTAPSSAPNSRQSRFLTGVHRPFSKIASMASFQSRSSEYYLHHITPYYLEEEEEENDKEKAHDEQDHEEKQEQGDPQEEKPTSAEDPSKTEEPQTKEKIEDHPRHEPMDKKPERFMICANELGPMTNETKRNSMVIFREDVRSRESSVATRESGARFSFSNTDESRGSSVPSSRDSSTSCGNDGVERAESVRSRSSTVRSTASSFVEIILSSCCQAYSAAFSPPAPVADRSTPKSHLLPSPLKRLVRRNLDARPNSAWKRLSSHSAFLPSSSVKPPSSSASNSSSLFSRRVHLP